MGSQETWSIFLASPLTLFNRFFNVLSWILLNGETKISTFRLTSLINLVAIKERVGGEERALQ